MFWWGGWGLLSCNFSAHRSVRAEARADLIWKHNFLSPPTAAAKVITLNLLFIPQTMEPVVDGWVGEQGGGAELGKGHRAPARVAFTFGGACRILHDGTFLESRLHHLHGRKRKREKKQPSCIGGVSRAGS